MNLLFENMNKKNKKGITKKNGQFVIDNHYLVFDQDIGKYVGNFSINMLHNMPSINYSIFSYYRNLGYGKRLLSDISKIIMEECYDTIYLLIDEDNHASIKVAGKCGYIIDENYTSLQRDNDMELRTLTMRLDNKNRRR